MEKISKEMIITDILRFDPGLAAILRNHGMNCVGCPSAPRESLEQAATGHGIDPDKLMEEMNAFLKDKGQ